MATIRILHHHTPGYGWSFDSPDLPGLTGGADGYDATAAEAAARFALDCEAKERGEEAPAEVSFEHYVPVGTPIAA